MSTMRNYKLGDTAIPIPFETTFNSVLFALAGSPTAAVRLAGSGTNITTGVSAVTASVNSVAGKNYVEIDTTSGYTAGKFYEVVLTAGTVNGFSAVDRVVGQFGLEHGQVMARLADGVTHGGTTADLSLKSIVVSNSAGSAVVFSSAGGNGSGLRVAGHGFGSGLSAIGGATGAGASFTGGSTSGNAITLQADGDGYGMLIAAAANSDGIIVSGSGTGVGIRASSVTVTNALLVSGATTFTGAITATDASNNIVGIDVAKISGDATAADNAELFFDGTGYAGGTTRLKVDVDTIKTNPVVNGGTITFPTGATLASTTNIVSGTLTTVTNLTNAPTAGDFTATMKASINTEADTALTDYGALKPTTTGRTLDVTATGGAGIDWGNVENQSTAVNLSATTTNLVNTVTTYTGNTVQTGDSYAVVNSGTHGNAALKTLIDAVDDAVDTEVGAIKAVTDKLDDTLEDDGGTYRFTANALEEAPSGGSAPSAADIADAVWDEATAGHTTSGTFGEQLKTDVDAILADTNELQTDWVDGGRLDLLLDDVPTTAEFNARTLVAAAYFDPATDTVAHVTLVDTTTTNTDMRGTDGAYTGTPPTVGEIADGVLDVAIAGHLSPGSVGDAIYVAATRTVSTHSASDVAALVTSDHGSGSYVRNTEPPSAATISTQVAADLLAAHGSGSWTTATGFAVAGDIPTAAQNAAGLLDLAAGVETGLTVRQAMRLIAAAAAGKLSGAGTTTITIRNAVADDKDRITATVDADGNRSAITVDLT